MAGLQAHRITNAAVYLDGNSYFGKAEEIDLGTINTVNSDFSALGLVGLMELPDGLDKLEGKIVWASLYEDAAVLTASPFQSVSLQCLSSINVHTSAGRIDELSLATHLTVNFKGYQLGTYKAREASKYETPFTASSIRQLIGGREVLLLDYHNNIFKVNGVDQLAKYRANLGLS